MNAQAEQNSGESPGTVAKKKRSLLSMLLWVVLSLAGIGAGFAAPMFFMTDASGSASKNRNADHPKMAIPDPSEEVVYIPFADKVVVNFNDPRFSRYLTMNFSVQVAQSQLVEIQKLMEQKHDVLRNWLISHIADKKVEDIRGKQGTNRLRREIHDSFNELLFTDGIERIQDVLFSELNVQ
jgi:flagellar basal body-associated protein FliL